MKTCLRCGSTKDVSKFVPEEGSNYFVHNVCNECRKFMDKRADYLIKCDKKFHEAQRESFELTSLYRRRILEK